MDCDFESPLWYRGHCNWAYTITTTKRLEWSYEVPEASKEDAIPQGWNLGNHFVTLTGKGVAELIGRTILHSQCTDFKSPYDDVGLMYRNTNDTEIHIIKRPLYYIEDYPDEEGTILTITTSSKGKWSKTPINKPLCGASKKRVSDSYSFGVQF